ncbi:MAG: hypothetical protein E7461_07325 [Ruminococcaceae bacterium]|nr:hypothetical protein [Oscillospiraceae bacterium]
MPGQIDGVAADIVFLVVAIGAACLQFFFSWKWDNVFAKLAPTLTLGIALVFSFIMIFLFPALLAVWGQWCLIFVAMLVADGAGWLAYAIYRMLEDGNPNIPEGM